MGGSGSRRFAHFPRRGRHAAILNRRTKKSKIFSSGHCERSSLLSGTLRAGTDRAKVLVGIDACWVAIRKWNLNGVLADRRRRLRAGLRLEHRQRGWRSKRGRRFSKRFFLDAFVVAGSARTVLAQVGKIEMARVPIGPHNIDARATADVNFYACGYPSLVNGQWHGE